MIKRLLVCGALTTGLLMALGGLARAQDFFVDGHAGAGKTKASQCAGCHGSDGNSTGAQFPNLAAQHAKYIYAQLKAFKSGARKNSIMNSMAAGLSDQDMKDLAVYFSQQKESMGVADPKLVDAGQALYRGGDMSKGIPACSGCHGPAGEGNPAAGFPRFAGQHAQYVAKQLKAYRSRERDEDKLATIMQAVAQHMSDKQIRALASYVDGLHRAKD